MMFLGYNTNGFAHHRLDDAVEILAELGYRGLALTLDVHHLNPNEPDIQGRTHALDLLRRRGRYRQCVVETGARFLLDRMKKHQPTLLASSAVDRETRFDLLQDAVRIARDLNEDGLGVVSFWSGTASTDDARPVLLARLVEQCQQLADFAAQCRVRLAFEPEPGMFIETMDQFAELHAKVNHPAFGLTIDVGHLVCNNELPVSQHLMVWKDWLWNVHIEDMCRGVHDHRMFGEGEVDFDDVFAGLRAAGYAFGVYVELSRHSHDAVNTARRSFEFLRRYLDG